MYKTNIFPELYDCFIYFSIIFIVLGIQFKIVENWKRCEKNIGWWTGMLIYTQRRKLQIFMIFYWTCNFLSFLLSLEIEQKFIENYQKSGNCVWMDHSVCRHGKHEILIFPTFLGCSLNFSMIFIVFNEWLKYYRKLSKV